MNKFLAVIICNAGYADECITVARNHGAKGGTVLTGRGTATGEETMFFQKYIEREKEILFIVLDESNKQSIVDSIEEELGPDTDAHALCICLNVESLSGFSNLI
jgi:hypothetical protein